jgi:uncharacterized membrane protein YfcA
MTWLTLLLLAAAGALGGFIDSIVGGGGLITVPALLFAGVTPQLALGTNKLQSSFGTSVSAFRCWRAGLIGARTVAFTAPVSFLCGACGAYCAAHSHPDVLKKVVPILLICAALYALLSPKLGDRTGTPRLAPLAFALVFGLVLGMYDGFFGPGTGMFWMMACVLVLCQDLRHAAGTTRVVNLASNLGALLIFMRSDCLRFDAGLAMIGGQLVGAQLGSGLVIARGARIIRPLYIVMALAIASRLLWDAFH